MENGGDDRSSEDQKIEEFFSLVRRFHEARSRRERELMLEMGEEKEGEEAIRTKSNNFNNKKAKTKREGVDQERPSWAPAFQWEDFTQEISVQIRKQPGLVLPYNKPGDYGFSNNCNKDERKRQLEQEAEEEGENDHRALDLNLAL